MTSIDRQLARRDLVGAPEKLRLLADWHDLKDAQAVVNPGPPEVQADLRRWADAIDRLLGGTPSSSPWWF